MQIRIKVRLILLLAAAAASAAGVGAHAQAAPQVEKQLRAELALDYTYVHSNAPPGDCGCINLNGGSATFAWLMRRHFALVGDVTVTRAAGISSDDDSLTLGAYTAGARYLPPLGHSRVQPFGQVLVGFAHSSGSLVENQSASTAGNAFAANVGGGLDVRANRRFSILIIEADYLVTTFTNGVNDHQNNLRISAGVVLHF